MEDNLRREIIEGLMRQRLGRLEGLRTVIPKADPALDQRLNQELENTENEIRMYRQDGRIPRYADVFETRVAP